MTKEAIIAELDRLGFANMFDYIRVTDEGDAVVDLSALDRDKAAAVQEVIVDTFLEGGGESAREVKRVRFKLADKRSALVDLAKHLGMFVERQRIPHEHADKTDDQLRDELAHLDRQLAKLGVSGAGNAPAAGVDKARPVAEGKAE